MNSMVGRNLSSSRIGWVYLALALVGGAGALGLAYLYHLNIAATATAMLPTMATLYLAWANFQANHEKTGGGKDLPQLADDLAEAVDGQWQEEARLRRMNDPYPLPVSWQPAQENLVESWPLLSIIAEAWPGGPPNEPEKWALKPQELVAEGSLIVDVFARRVPTRRLIVLGEPGSGKTMLLIRLVQGLIAERAAGASLAVPVIFSLASWSPTNHELLAWMAACLARDYPGLAEPAPAPHGNVSRARALLDQHLILPVLDGFDELPVNVLPIALDAINRSLVPGQGLVLSCRTREYEYATRSANGVHMRLVGAAGIELVPLNAEIATEYLLRDAGNDAAATQRWLPVTRLLGTASPIGLALRTPLMLFLARTIFNPRPGDLSGGRLPDPAVLCDYQNMPNRSSVERYLLSRFIPAAYRIATLDSPVPWTAKSAEHSLTFIACHLQHAMDGSPDFAWWQLPRAMPRNFLSVLLWTTTLIALAAPVAGVAGFIAGVLYGLAVRIIDNSWEGIGSGVLVGSIGGMVGGVVFGCTAAMLTVVRSALARRKKIWLGDSSPWRRVGWAWNTNSVVLAVLVGICVGAVSGTALGATFALISGAPVSIAGVIWAGLRASPADVTKASGPEALLAQERRSILLGGLAFSTLGAATAAIVFAIAGVRAGGATDGIAVGVAVGLILGAVGKVNRSAWLPFLATRWYLTFKHRTPRDLISFLVDAHKRRGVLRQVGGIYQFRHLDLQRCLADLPLPRRTD